MAGSIPSEYDGRGFVPGGAGSPSFRSIDRQAVEHYLRSWFAWLADRSRIHLRPASMSLDAEFFIRRWKTRTDIVQFRWRNSDNTRGSFSEVREALQDSHPEATLERTAKLGRPRAVVMEFDLADLHAPASVVQLSLQAFLAAGLPPVRLFDLRCSAHVMGSGSGDVPLEPLSKPFAAGQRIGTAIRHLTGGSDITSVSS